MREREREKKERCLRCIIKVVLSRTKKKKKENIGATFDNCERD